MTFSEGVTIGSFLVLAGLTFWYARETKKLADQAEEATEAARRSAESAERMLQLESLPIVWGRRGFISKNPREGVVQVIARNVGRGVALGVSCWIQADGLVVGPIEIDTALDPTVGESQVRLPLSASEIGAIDRKDYTIVCEYYDAGGHQYQTRWSPQGSEIVEIAEDGSERRILRT